MIKKLLLYISAILLTACTARKTNSIEKNFLLPDEGEAKYYLVDQIRIAQKDKRLGENPMLIINGSVIYYSYKEKIEPIQIKESQIKTIQFTTAENCVCLYGKACADGLVTITASY